MTLLQTVLVYFTLPLRTSLDFIHENSMQITIEDYEILIKNNHRNVMLEH